MCKFITFKKNGEINRAKTNDCGERTCRYSDIARVYAATSDEGHSRYGYLTGGGVSKNYRSLTRARRNRRFSTKVGGIFFSPVLALMELFSFDWIYSDRCRSRRF
jgi:hypothetical protein